ncbi:hypothetical protein DOE76_06740 [Leifsonia sp. ku-ls]|nr:hypothetical protein DOE76_06740 [Leifsonia sp. ku-ls]
MLERAGIDPSALRVRHEPVPAEPTHRYANGLSSELPLSAAELWKRHTSMPLVVIVYGGVGAGHDAWFRELRAEFPVHFLVPAASAESLSVPAEWFTPCGFVQDAARTRLEPVLRWVHQHWRRCDLLFVDADQSLPRAQDLLRLQHAAHAYDVDDETGIVTPGHRVDGGFHAGFDYDRRRGAFVSVGGAAPDYGQDSMPRFVLTALAHGTLVRADAVDRVLRPSSDGELATTLDEDISLFVGRAWHQGVRTLSYPTVVLARHDLPVPPVTPWHTAWLTDRRVTNAEGARRIIFVLNATSISGGIRVVFEEAEGLAVRGFDVEIWSLQGQPDWTDLAIPVTTFRSYFDMLVALRKEEAIKVATWWETQQVVWLASVTTGIPVSFAQEFEAWFYPTQPVSRAAVASSARREFDTLTTGSYQAAELGALGIDSTIVPVGYDPRLFFPLDRVERKEGTLLAVGRSFFQKNFRLTAEAWRSLGDDRPELVLFGYEPDILVDERVNYEMRPSHRRVNELYNEASAFVLTSLHEGFGLPLIEAMAAGCPVITTDSHGNRDFCVDGVNCIVVPSDDPQPLAEAITRLLGDQELRARLSAAGLRTAEDYAWPVVLDRIAEYYAGVA